MFFNPDKYKQAKEVIFSKKHLKADHGPPLLTNIQVYQTPIQKHFGLFLDEKLSFQHHIKKASHGIRGIHQYNSILPCQALLTIYKPFVRSHLDYGYIIYDLPNNANFCKKIESVQRKAALEINDAIKGTSRTKLYKELGLESLTFRM